MLTDASTNSRIGVVAAIVLHANPDKFNGTASLQARGIEVFTSAQVIAQIPKIHTKRTASFGKRYAPDYPTALPQPKSFGDTNTTLELAGLQLKAHVFGPGCSEAHVALEWQGHLFVGDLVANGAHSWMELGLSGPWLHRIDELTTLDTKHVHPGRGASDGPELLKAQTEYLKRVRSLVSTEHAALHEGEHEPTQHEIDEALSRVQSTLKQEYPKYNYAVFLNIGLPAEWQHAGELGELGVTGANRD